MRKVLSNIVFYTVIFICGYLIIANILHILYLNKYDTFDFNSELMIKIKENVNTLESNIKKISKLDNSVYSKEDLELIKDNLNSNLENIKSDKLLNYRGVKKFYLTDLLTVDIQADRKTSENIKLLKTLSEYDSFITNFIDLYKYDFIDSAYSYDMAVQETYQAYKYNTLDFFNANVYEPMNNRILVRIYNLSYYIAKENYIAKLVLEIGGDNNE